MKSKEEMLAAKMLDLASDEFSNHGCNDVEESVYEGWTLDERKQFVKEFWEWNGSPEDYDEKFLHLQDHSIMAFLAFKLKLSADAAMHAFASRKPAGEGYSLDDMMNWAEKDGWVWNESMWRKDGWRSRCTLDLQSLYISTLPAPPTNTSDTQPS